VIVHERPWAPYVTAQTGNVTVAAVRGEAPDDEATVMIAQGDSAIILTAGEARETWRLLGLELPRIQRAPDWDATSLKIVVSIQTADDTSDEGFVDLAIACDVPENEDDPEFIGGFVGQAVYAAVATLHGIEVDEDGESTPEAAA
jgi:hypothetical protein